MLENQENDSTEQKPVIADKKPAVMKMEAGEYWWCSCGQSSKQPFCDGSHQGTSFQPQKWFWKKIKMWHFVSVNIPQMVPFATVPMPVCKSLSCS